MEGGDFGVFEGVRYFTIRGVEHIMAAKWKLMIAILTMDYLIMDKFQIYNLEFFRLQLFHLGFFFSVDILKIDVDMSFSLGYRDMATNDDPTNVIM